MRILTATLILTIWAASVWSQGLQPPPHHGIFAFNDAGQMVELPGMDAAEWDMAYAKGALNPTQPIAAGNFVRVRENSPIIVYLTPRNVERLTVVDIYSEITMDHTLTPVPGGSGMQVLRLSEDVHSGIIAFCLGGQWPNMDRTHLALFGEEGEGLWLRLAPKLLELDQIRLEFLAGTIPEDLDPEIIDLMKIRYESRTHLEAPDTVEDMEMNIADGTVPEEALQAPLYERGTREAQATPPSNLNPTQTHNSVRRVQADLRTMATALESYFIDHNAYPPHIAGTDPHAAGHGNPLFSNVTSLRAGIWEASQAYTLTTPVAYLRDHFPDAFNPPSGDIAPTFAYWSNVVGWILWSPGPDGDFDITTKAIEGEMIYNPFITQPSSVLIPFYFDPTNGLNSSGDIFRVRM